MNFVGIFPLENMLLPHENGNFQNPLIYEFSLLSQVDVNKPKVRFASKF